MQVIQFKRSQRKHTGFNKEHEWLKDPHKQKSERIEGNICLQHY